MRCSSCFNVTTIKTQHNSCTVVINQEQKKKDKSSDSATVSSASHMSSRQEDSEDDTVEVKETANHDVITAFANIYENR